MTKWNLNEYYVNEKDWHKDLETLKSYIPKLASFQGKLGNYNDFLEYYKLEEESTKLFYRLYGYAHLSSDLNLKDVEKASMQQQVMIAVSELSQKTAWSSPEVLALGEEKVLDFLSKDAFLKTYVFPIKNLFRQQKHVLSEDQEKILANFGPTSSIPSNLYQSVSIVDAKNEKIVLDNGDEVEVTSSNYRSLIANSKSAADRKKIFAAAFKRYKDNKSTFANIYNLVLQQKAANYKSRNYESALNAALFGNNIPESVFHNLKDTAYENTAAIKKYINLRKSYLKLDEYYTYDRFINLAHDDTKYDYELSRKLFFASIEGLDEEFVKMQHEALAPGFVDVYPSDGKRTGGYSSSLYGYHPYILLNHDYTLDAVFTLAHEAGHSAHSLFSNANQPMPIARYTIFVAEIASTFNEHLLLDYLLKNAKTKEQKIDLLQTAIDGIMATFFRQTLFATYEFEASELVRKGMPINADVLSKIMIDLYKHYYDLDITKEDGKQYVWAYIPHLFHTPFYVYQYATSYSASLKIYDNIKSGKKDAFENFKKMLKSGGSDFPVNQAKLAGADLTDKETFRAVIKRFNFLVDELEKTLTEK
ncbi:oligoendopeptidase F [Haploplasma axanthum]|uniref:Oligopeptidase F n=1 Tax=Haploplasma axanthum TaxID=29552 RepID=A0A449BFE9_HAPAX|nr:oligoendopeptidase F [Haploplasma axanthum]VEU81174.1 Oligoendopeptidase F, plasmid [Haploplasma axanthum]